MLAEEIWLKLKSSSTDRHENLSAEVDRLFGSPSILGVFSSSSVRIMGFEASTRIFVL